MSTIKLPHRGTRPDAYVSKDVAFSVSYYDMELEIVFKKGRIAAPYLLLDHNLRANASGWAGVMFPFDKLSPALEAASKDIEAHYGSVLRGDASMWQKIEKLVLASRPGKGGPAKGVRLWGLG